MKNEIIGITGASGFIGRGLTKGLENLGYSIRRYVRLSKVNKDNEFQMGSISRDTSWINLLSGVQCLIHCAAIVHNQHRGLNCLEDEIFEVNTYATINLARQAAAQGVKRFIFISTIKVNGEETDQLLNGEAIAFSAFDIPKPNGLYALSKLKAEIGLKQVAKDTGLEVVILRLPLVYGPGVKANFLKLIKLSKLGVPLPFGAFRNKRSFLYIENLVGLVTQCIFSNQAPGNTFMASDDDDISTSDLIHLISSEAGEPAKIFYFPAFFFQVLSYLFRLDAVKKLSSSLVADVSHTKKTLMWMPSYSIKEGISKTLKNFY